MTAEDEGLSRRERLFSRVGARTTPALRRLAIASLLRVGGDGFTLEAVNQTISGCGVRAVAAETDEQGVVRVTFPQVADEPAPTVVLSEYGASSISYLVRLWVSAADYWTVYYGMNEKVRETFAAHGVEMTYDHLNVHMIKD